MKVGQALEYLSQVLSQRGPQAVPYDEGAKWKIREHLSELLKVRTGAAGWNGGRLWHVCVCVACTWVPFSCVCADTCSGPSTCNQLVLCAFCCCTNRCRVCLCADVSTLEGGGQRVPCKQREVRCCAEQLRLCISCNAVAVHKQLVCMLPSCNGWHTHSSRATAPQQHNTTAVARRAGSCTCSRQRAPSQSTTRLVAGCLQATAASTQQLSQKANTTAFKAQTFWRESPTPWFNAVAVKPKAHSVTFKLLVLAPPCACIPRYGCVAAMLCCALNHPHQHMHVLVACLSCTCFSVCQPTQTQTTHTHTTGCQVQHPHPDMAARALPLAAPAGVRHTHVKHDCKDRSLFC